MAVRRVKSQVLTMNDAVRSLMGLISRPPEEAALATFLKLDIAQFVEERVRDEFVHLCAHLAHNAMLNGSLEVNPAACQLLVGSVTGTDWAIPVCTTMLEVRLKNGTLSSMSEAEKRYILEFYGLKPQSFDHTKFEYYRSGTTSIIFRSNDVAIKLIRPVYVVDSAIASLDIYASQNQNIANRPEIIDSNSKYLVMELIKGNTIYECIHQSDLGLGVSKRTEIALKIVEAVSEIHRQKQVHGDLSPRNMIIDRDAEIRFIDFGVNYSLKRPLLSVNDQAEALRYVPMGGREDFALEDPYSVDIYAVAGIILDLIMADRIRQGQINDHYDLLDEYFKDLPDHDLPLLLEDCLAPDPAMRLARYRKSMPSHLLASKLSSELRDAAKEDSATNVVSESEVSILKNLREFVELLGLLFSKERKNIQQDEQRKYRILFFRKFCQFITGVAMSLALASLYASFDRGGEDMLVKMRDMKEWWAGTGLSLTPRDASGPDQLPGHLICISFLFLASRYYLTIFAKLKLTDSNRFGMIKSQWVIWANSFAYTIPISYCFLLDPKSWPFCSALGLLLVAYNNKAVKYTLNHITKSVEFHRVAAKISVDANRNFKDIFGGWARLVSWYAIGIILAGIVLSTSTPVRNPLLDRLWGATTGYNAFEIFLAFAVMGINYFKMQRENCGALAPSIRNMIRRYFTAAESILSKQDAPATSTQ